MISRRLDFVPLVPGVYKKYKNKKDTARQITWMLNFQRTNGIPNDSIVWRVQRVRERKGIGDSFMKSLLPTACDLFRQFLSTAKSGPTRCYCICTGRGVEMAREHPGVCRTQWLAKPKWNVLECVIAALMANFAINDFDGQIVHWDQVSDQNCLV